MPDSVLASLVGKNGVNESNEQPGNERMIPFNRVSPVGQELQYVKEAAEGCHLSGDGPFGKKCEALLRTLVGGGRVLLTPSCTHALEMSALLLGIRPGDEVVLPSFTFVSTANAFVLFGARPVFCDISPDTLNLDPERVKPLLTSATKAIVPVHYGGVGCDMDGLRNLAEAQGIDLVEDNAHGLFGAYRGRPLGSFGRLATLSFHETKNIACGEGGALVVNDETLIERAEIVREKGTNRSQFFRGHAEKYSWIDLGSSYLPSELASAFLFGQLEQRTAIQGRRRAIWNYYYEHLADWAECHRVRLPVVPTHCDPAYHLFYLLLPSSSERDALLDRLKADGIMSVFHYLPLNTSPMGRKFGGVVGGCPVAESVSERLLRLPFFVGLSDSDLERIVRSIVRWRP